MEVTDEGDLEELGGTTLRFLFKKKGGKGGE
jgi:hypothetical protein